MTEITFAQLPETEFAAAVAILVEVTEWLLSKGIQQWLQPLPEAIYRQRQDAGENYALYVDGTLAAVVSLMTYRPIYWAEYLPETPFIWLGTLAVARRFAGQNLGEVTVKRAVEAVRQRLQPGESTFIYMDCLYGTGFLPAFYTRLGFETLTRQLLQSPVQAYDGVLMRLPVQCTSS